MGERVGWLCLIAGLLRQLWHSGRSGDFRVHGVACHNDGNMFQAASSVRVHSHVGSVCAKIVKSQCTKVLFVDR